MKENAWIVERIANDRSTRGKLQCSCPWTERRRVFALILPSDGEFYNPSFNGLVSLRGSLRIRSVVNCKARIGV